MCYLSTSFSAKTMNNYIIDKEKCVDIIELNIKPITRPENTNNMLGSKNKRMKETLWGKRKQHRGWHGKSVLQFPKCTSKSVNYLFVYVWVNNTYILPHIIPTRYVEASLEDLIHGLGVIMVMSQQLGAVTHHGPTTSIFMLMQRERKSTINHFHLFVWSKLLGYWYQN